MIRWCLVSFINLNCPICNGTKFGPGPGGRMSIKGMPPRCEKCQSLERHRIMRIFHLKLKNIFDYSNYDVLQISKDFSVIPDWFKSYDMSIYGVQNSIDIQNINLTKSYDVVICNHVLEHVEKWKIAILQLQQITSINGFLQISFPDPFNRQKTTDWGYPKKEDHGHYRIFGKDCIEIIFKELLLPGSFMHQIQEIDNATGTEDIFYLLTKSSQNSTLISSNFPNSLISL